MSRRKPYFHLIPDDQWERMKASGMKWEQVMREYAPPAWCGYPSAVDPMGCWSLVGRMVKDRAYCTQCDCYRPTVARVGYFAMTLENAASAADPLRLP